MKVVDAEHMKVPTHVEAVKLVVEALRPHMQES
jgi:hypothetical protein